MFVLVEFHVTTDETIFAVLSEELGVQARQRESHKIVFPGGAVNQECSVEIYPSMKRPESQDRYIGHIRDEFLAKLGESVAALSGKYCPLGFIRTGNQ